MKRSLKKLFFTAIFIVVTNVVYAAGPPPPHGLPVDGGIGFLIISGILYGVLKLRNKK